MPTVRLSFGVSQRTAWAVDAPLNRLPRRRIGPRVPNSVSEHPLTSLLDTGAARTRSPTVQPEQREAAG